MKLAFIGVGNMGGAIARAVCSAVDPDAVWLSNRSPDKAEALAAALGCHAAVDNVACTVDADLVFLGVKPRQVEAVLGEIAPVLSKRCVVVSMAAGVSGGVMRAALGTTNPIVRILPNTPCAIGKGLVLLAPCGDVDEAVLARLEALLAPCGLVARTDEEHADAGMTIGGCTPAFTYMFIEALADGAVQTGLKRADALAWAAQAVAGAAELLLQSGQHPGALKDAVCSPGGSTIEGVRTLEDAAFRGAVTEAVIAASEKSKKLLG